MTKYDLENFDPNDSPSINISVYKPDGILSFWNWFTKRNKNDGQRKNIQFKINKEDLEKIKQSGFDFQKLQNLDLSNKNKAARPGKVFAIPKTDLAPFLIKSLHPGMRSKAYVKRLISKSTISIRSKESCANLKYVRTVKSVVNSVQSSKTSFKISVRSSTNVHSNQQQQHPRNMFLKSVPTTVLKRNTKESFILRKGESHKGNGTARTNASENIQQHSNATPKVLTRIKSTEEHSIDKENKKKKNNEAVFQRHYIKEINTQKDLSNTTEQNSQKAAKCVASHKIYTKNIHAPRKKKKNRPKKSKKRSNTNIPSPNEASLKPKPHNNGFAFNYFSDSSNEFKNLNELGWCDNNNNNTGIVFHQRGFNLPHNISKVEFSPENANNVDCDLIKSVVKALTESKGSTNLRQMDNSSTRNDPQYPNTSTKVGVVNLGRSNLISKSTFDWKHPRVSTSSGLPISETGKSIKENTKVEKNISATFGNQDVSNDSSERNYILKQILDPNLQKQLVLELLRNHNTTVQGETTTTRSPPQTCRVGKPIETIKLLNPDLEVTEYKQRNVTVDNIENPKIGCEKKESTQACAKLKLNKQNSATSTTVTENHKETNLPRLEREQFQSVKSGDGLQGNDPLSDVGECSTSESGHKSLCTREENRPEVTLDRGTLCSVNIERNATSAAFNKATEKQLKRTTISCSDAKKEPKVSITIVVEDGMKSEVEMKSNILMNPSAFRDERVDKSPKEDHSPPPLSSLGARGDHVTTVPSNTCKTESFCSLGSLSSGSCVNEKNGKVSVPKITVEKSPYSRTNKNFYVEVEDDGKPTFSDEDFNFVSPGTYLNHEKRKVLEEKVLSYNKNKPLAQYVHEKETVLPNRSCSNISNGLTTFDHMIETSFIRKETSYSKTKFNISKENKYSSKTSLKPLESTKRCMFSDESLNTENNFDVSTKYTSQQCVMYCRNKSLANFNRPHLFRDKSSGNTEQIKQPFVVVQTSNITNNRDDLEIDRNTKSYKVWEKKGVCSNIREDPILEVSEDESVVENLVLHGEEIDEKNCIEIKKSQGSLRNNHDQNNVNVNNSSSTKNILDNIDKHNRQTHKIVHGDGQAQHEDGVTTESNLNDRNPPTMCDCGHPESELKDNGSTTNEPRNRRGTTTLASRISQTELSSTLVQTDWSLVGMTVGHLNCSNNKSELAGCRKRTIASQTDVMMDQIALMNKGLECVHNGCKSCLKNCQFSELVACNVTVSHQATNLQETPKNFMGNTQLDPFSDSQNQKETQIPGMLVTVVKEKDSNIFEYTTSALPINEDMLESYLHEQIQTPTLSISKKQSSKLKLVPQYYENKSEENVRNVPQDFPHRCTIPCLTSLSDETVMSSLSGSSNKVTSLGILGCYKVPQIHVINRGIDSYYNSLAEKCGSNHLLSPIVESRPSTSDTTHSAFCRVLDKFGVNGEDSSQVELCTESLTSLGATEPVQDPIVELMDLSQGCLDRQYEINVQLGEETKPEPVSEAKKVIKSTNGKQRISNKDTPGKATKRDCSSVDKCTDYMTQYLSIERCDDEKKGNSLFSQT